MSRQPIWPPGFGPLYGLMGQSRPICENPHPDTQKPGSAGARPQRHL